MPMIDPAPHNDPTPHRTSMGLAARSRGVVAGAWEAAGILLSATGLAWLVRLLVLRAPVQGAWALQVLLALSAFLAGSWGAVHRYRTWTLPMRQLQLLLAK